MTIGLRLGDWRDVLVGFECDALIVDAPYGERTHVGHDAGVEHADHDWGHSPTGARSGGGPAARRRILAYSSWGPDDVRDFVTAWAPRTRGWFGAMSCIDLAPVWRQALEDSGRVTFAPVACVIRAMSVRLSGDGPSSWVVYLNVARPRSLEAARWGTLPGAYVVNRDPGHIGGKPLDLMLAIIRDYSRPGDLVCDPCAGLATTLLAAEMMGRRAIGAEIDPETHAKATARLHEATQLGLPGPRLAERPARDDEPETVPQLSLLGRTA